MGKGKESVDGFLLKKHEKKWIRELGKALVISEADTEGNRSDGYSKKKQGRKLRERSKQLTTGVPHIRKTQKTIRWKKILGTQNNDRETQIDLGNKEGDVTLKKESEAI